MHMFTSLSLSEDYYSDAFLHQSKYSYIFVREDGSPGDSETEDEYDYLGQI